MDMVIRIEEINSYVEARRSLTNEVKECIIDALLLEEAPELIGNDAPLFGSGLGLDSVDALGLAAGIEQRFGVEVADTEISLFRSVNAIVDYILEKTEAWPAIRETAGRLREAIGVDEAPESGEREPNAYRSARHGLLVGRMSPTERVSVSGRDALDCLARSVTGNVSELAVGDLLQSLMLDDAGKIAAIVWIYARSSDYLVLGDGDVDQGIGDLLECGRQDGQEVELRSETETHDLLSVSGPEAQDFVTDYFSSDLLRLAYCQGMELDHAGVQVSICRYGDSGEFDFRVLGPRNAIGALEEEIAKSSMARTIPPSEKELRRVLAMEMKSPRRAFLDEGSSPFSIGVEWAVQFSREDFRGRDALEAERRGSGRRAILLTYSDGSVLQQGASIGIGDRTVGKVKSSAYSPTLGLTVSWAYVDQEYAWPLVPFSVETEGQVVEAWSRSAPLFVTRTVTDNLNL